MKSRFSPANRKHANTRGEDKHTEGEHGQQEALYFRPGDKWLWLMWQRVFLTKSLVSPAWPASPVEPGGVWQERYSQSAPFFFLMRSSGCVCGAAAEENTYSQTSPGTRRYLKWNISICVPTAPSLSSSGQCDDCRQNVVPLQLGSTTALPHTHLHLSLRLSISFYLSAPVISLLLFSPSDTIISRVPTQHNR